MSDTGESDDAAINFNNRRGRNKRKIIMKFEYEEDTSSGSDSEEDYIRVSTRTNVKRKRKSVVYSDDGSASDNEVNDVTNKDPCTSSKASTSKACEEEVGCASDSSNDETEKCPICLLSFRNQEIASPATCDHTFCFLCIDEWAKNVSTCPIDRREFKSILVFDSYINKKLIREDQVNKIECNDKVEDNDITFCEICNRSNREDVMLLCDGCNQGYHMDCLTPPISEIPEGFWYCDNCFESEGEDVAEDINALYEDLREMGVPENQFRITELRQTRIPRTRQSERIRASIAARTRNRQPRSSQQNEEPIPSTSSIQRARNVNNTQRKRKSRKRRKNRRRRTYVVEYDVNNFDEKFEIKTSKKYVKKRKAKRRCKKTFASSKRSDADIANCVNEFGMTRSRFAIIPSRSLSLFGNPNDLEYFSDEDNTTVADGGGTAIQTAVRFRNIGSLHRRKGQLTIPEPTVAQTGSSDVLSSILDLQEMWHNTTRRNQLDSVEIGEDGTLNFDKVGKPTSKDSGKDEKNKSNNNNVGEVTQAPLYPRGNNPNFSNTNNNQGNRYNNQNDNYRNSSGGSTSNFSNSNFRNSTGSIGFNFPFRRNDNAGPLQFSLTNRNPNFRDRQRNQRNGRRTANPLFTDPNQFNIEPLNPPPAFDEINVGNISEADNFTNNEASSGQSNNSAPVYGPENIDFSVLPPPPPPPSSTSESTEIIPPLAPPPWNQNLFRLAGDYGDDDDDADCPNFSIYSAESLQVARSGETEKEATEEKAKEQHSEINRLINAFATKIGGTVSHMPLTRSSQSEDDFEDKQEDLVQLGDDDDIPDAIDNNKNDESFSYKPVVQEQETYESESENFNPTGSIDMEVCNDETGDTEPKTPPLESLKNPDAPLMSIEDITIPSGEPKTASDSPKTPAESPKTKADSPKTPLGSPKTPSESIPTKDVSSDKAKDKTRRTNKKGVLELYDDSDWEDWNVDKNELMKKPVEETKVTPPSDENEINIQKIINHEEGSLEVGEQERSYTPCLDENVTDPLEGLINPPPPETSEKDEGEIEAEADVSTAVIDGIETELISEEEDILNSGNAATGKKKSGKDGPANQAKRKATEQFKKIGKSTKRRNYRGEIERKPKRGRSRSRSNEKENRRYSRNVRKRTRRKEIERYDVRNVIGQPRTYKDRYGRDTSRPAKSRSVSRSRRKTVRSKSRSRSTSSKRKRQTSFSMSPSPVSLTRSPRRRSFSPRRSRSRRSRSQRRSPIRRRSRSPLRLRSPSPARVNGRRFRKNRRESYSSSSSSRSRSMSRGFTPRKSPPRSITKTKRKRSKERKKKKIRKRVSSFSSSPQKRSARPARVQIYRKKKRSLAKSPVIEREWSATPEQLLTQINDSSWTPPLAAHHDRNVRLVLRNRENAQNRKKKREKKRKEKRRESGSKREKRRRRSEMRESPVAAPSKEVFASGDNILVSVSFNKDASGQNQQTTVVTLPPTREEIGLGRTPDRILRRQKKPVRSRRYRKVDTKPVAIIDLDRSPFQEIVQSPRDVIILTDSDHGEEDNQQINNHNESREIQTLQQVDEDHQIENSENRQTIDRTENSQEESFESSLQQLGPKTPPEPPVINKFTITTKQKQLKRTTLLDEPEDLANESLDKEVQDIEMQNANKIGPNTPPESGPCSPDAYDPFDPTKSPSATPSPTPAAEGSTPTNENESRPNDEPRETRPTNQDINPVELVMALMSSKTAKQQELANLSAESQYNASTNVDLTEPADKQDDSIKAITVLSNVLITPGKQQQRSANITNITSPVQKTSQSVISKLPLPKTSSNNRHNGGANMEEMLDFDSPYSPGSNDFDDLFDPPNENITTLQQLSRTRKGGNKNKSDLLDNLFGSSSPVRMANYSLLNVKKRGKPYKKTSVKVAKMPGAEDIKILDELPSSAVELQVKDKFLRKLNRQERVVEEVKVYLKPHYNKKHVTKEEYKEILRRAVPKICHSRSGEINPKKIQNLIEAYVRKFRQRNKLGLLNTGQVSSAVKCAAYLKKL